MYTKAVFLDKDGTLVENVPYNADPEKIRLLDSVLEGLRLLHEEGYKLIIVSNQAGVAHGHFPESALEAIGQRISQLFRAAKIPLSGFYYCPHHPDGMIPNYALTCFCRKPSPGLLFRAAREHQLSLTDSWMIGDILDDVEAGRRADCRAILVNNGNETVWRNTPLRRPNFTVDNFLEAAQAILTNDRVRKQAGSQTLPVKVRRIQVEILRKGSGKSKGISARLKKGEYARKSTPGD
jgi:D,D-heptose 1,7-bisphosphate phosphatase